MAHGEKVDGETLSLVKKLLDTILPEDKDTTLVRLDDSGMVTIKLTPEIVARALTDKEALDRIDEEYSLKDYAALMSDDADLRKKLQEEKQVAKNEHLDLLGNIAMPDLLSGIEVSAIDNIAEFTIPDSAVPSKKELNVLIAAAEERNAPTSVVRDREVSAQVEANNMINYRTRL